MRPRPDALILIAIYEFVMAAMLLIAACVVLPIALLIIPFASDGFGQFIRRFVVVGLVLTIVFGFGIASGIVGVGLLLLREWARIGAILLAIPALVVFPIWTVLAILILVYLAGEEGQALFRQTHRGATVSARTFHQEARADEPSISPSVVPASADPAVDDRRNDADMTNAPEEPGAESTWYEPVEEVDNPETPGDDVSKPPAN